ANRRLRVPGLTAFRLLAAAITTFRLRARLRPVLRDATPRVPMRAHRSSRAGRVRAAPGLPRPRARAAPDRAAEMPDHREVPYETFDYRAVVAASDRQRLSLDQSASR